MQYYRKLIQTLPNGNRVEYNMKNGVSVACGTINAGFENEQKAFKIKGKVQKNKANTIGSISIKSPDNKMFEKAPGLSKGLSTRRSSNNNQVKLKLKKINRDDNNNIIEYIYSIIYTAKSKISSSSPMSFNFSSVSQDILNRVLGIKSLKCDYGVIYEGGGKKKIIIKGDKNTEFKLNVCSVKEQNGAIVETSLIGDVISNYQHDGKNTISGKINDSGTYTYIQEFPTETEETNYAIHLQGSSYSDSFDASLYEKDKVGWNGWYCKTIKQVMDPTVTIRTKLLDNTSSGKAVTINGATTDATTHYDKLYKGRYDSPASPLNGYATATGTGGGINLNQFEIEYILTTNSGAFSILKSDIASGDFSNMIQDSGGNFVSVTTITPPVLSHANRTCSLKLRFIISKWGTSDVTMSLDFNTIVTIS